MVLGMFNDTEIADRISTGDVIVDLQRPYDHQAWWAGVSYGKAAYYVRVPRRPAVPRRRPRVPPAPAVARRARPAFVVSVALAVGVAFGWRYLLQLTAFWLLDVRGANQLGWLAAQFLSGAFLPIVFFPDWLETTARALPVRVDAPATRSRSGSAATRALELLGGVRPAGGVGGGARARPAAT